MVAYVPDHTASLAEDRVGFAWSAADNLIVGRLAGQVDQATLCGSLGQAMRAGAFRRGADRILTVSPAARMHCIDIDALRAVKAVVEAHETQNGRLSAYRCAIVCPDRVRRPVMELYRMLWTPPAAPPSWPRYTVHDDAEAALRWLQRPDAAIRPLMV